MIDRLLRESPRRKRVDEGVASFSRGAFMAAVAGSMGAFMREELGDGNTLTAIWIALSLFACGAIALLLLVHGLFAIALATVSTADRGRGKVGLRSFLAVALCVICLGPLIYFLLILSFQGADRALDYFDTSRSGAQAAPD